MQEAILCQRAEVEFAGVPCGLLDQFSSLFGEAGRVLFLDCDTLAHAALPAGGGLRVILADTGVRHALADGQYAALRRSCERAAARLGELLGRPVRFLRDVALEEFLPLADRLEPEDRPRAEHVIRENARVLEGRAALGRGDIAALGRLMVRSHASSRDLFGNSCPELDLLVEEAERLPGFIGGKLSGGGFGGSTVNLVEAARAESFARELSGRYRARTGKATRLLASAIGAGARAVAYR
jgi:galactokinase